MQAWLPVNGTDAVAAAVGAYFPDVAPDVLADALRRYGAASLWAASPAISPKGFARLAESLVSGGFLSRLPSYEACVAGSLA